MMRPMMTVWMLCAVLVASSCIAPRAGVFGTMPRPVGKGEYEVSLSDGLMVLTSQSTSDDGSTSTSTIETPTAEGHLLYGISERADLSYHVSPGGSAFGLKYAMGPVAIMPEAGVAFFSYEDDATTVTQNRWTVGAKALLALGAGYVGAGYGMRFDIVNSRISGTDDSDTITFSDVMGAVGWEFNRAGPCQTRVELSGVYSVSTDDPDDTATMILSSVTFAVGSKRPASSGDR